jgi:hypothetical protein
LNNEEPYKNVPKRKGSIAEAEGGEDTLLRVAYDMRNRKVIMSLPPDTAASPQTSPDSTPMPTIRRMSISPDHSVSAGEDLKFLTRDWMRVASMAFEFPPHRAEAISRISIENIQTTVGLLSSLLKKRLEKHIKNRIQEERKHRHWCLIWA